MKRVLIGIAVVLLTIAVLAIAAVVGLTLYALPWMTAHIARTTGYQINAQSMDFRFRRGIVLKNIQVFSPEQKEIFAAERLYVRPRWEALIRRRELVIEEVSVDMAQGRLTGRGQVSQEFDADVRVEFRKKTTRASASASGVLTAKLIKGRGKIVAQLSQGALQLSAAAQVDMPNKKIEATLRTGRYQWQAGLPQPWDIDRLSVQLKGNLSRWHVQALTHFHKPASLRYVGTVEKLDAGWQIGWDSIVWHLPAGPTGQPPETDWRTTRSGAATLNEKGKINISDLSMSDGRGRLQLAAVLGKPAQDISLKARDVSLNPILAWAYPSRTIEGYVDGKVHLQGTAKEPTGQVDVAISSGRVNDMAFQHIQARARLEPPWIVVERFEMEVPQTGKNVTGSGRLPWHLVQPASPNLPLDLRLKTADIDLRFLGNFMPGWDIEPGGHLSIQALVQGLYPKVTVEGHAAAKVPVIRYAEAGVVLKDLDIELQSLGRHAEIKRGQASLGKGTMHLAGKIVWPSLDITVTADKATLSIPKKFELKTDAQIHLGGDLQAPELTGEVRPKEGTYTVPKKEKKVAEKPTSEPSAIWRALRMDIRTAWDRGLWYRDGLTKIETAGDLHIRKSRGSTEATLLGPLSLVRGSYDAYGRDFVIESGDINFTGTPEMNPVLSIQAQYRTQDVLINLSVSGTAERPRLKFTSSPPLSEQEIISVLMTGKSVTTFGSTTDTRADDEAKQMAADVASSYLTRSLRDSGLNLGLDVVRVTPSATGTVWTVGRYLRPDLFVSYGQNPKDSASSVVNADYSLSRRWSISSQASSSSDTYLDFLFRYPLKRRSSKK